MTDERVARAGLSRLTEPGQPRVNAAVLHAGAVRVHDEVVEARASTQLAVDVASRVADHDPRRDLERAAAQGIRFVIPGDDEWPTQVDDLGHAEHVQDMGGPPVGLWVRGPLRLDRVTDSVAVVGARAATTYGESVARDVAAGVARAGRCVVSGGAFGIDQAAHRGALAVDGPTIAVLACGVDRSYPPAHRELLEHIAEVGAVVSEVPPGCAPLRLRFLSRNRLIAALTAGTVVVEAAARSGALNTASWATALNRPLMGVPGPVTSAQSQGVHDRLRSGAATVVTGPADVLELVGGAGEHLLAEPRGPERQRDRLSRRHHRVLEAVPRRRPAELSAIAATAGIGLRETHTALGYLVAHEFVVREPTGWRLGPRALDDLRRSGS